MSDIYIQKEIAEVYAVEHPEYRRALEEVVDFCENVKGMAGPHSILGIEANSGVRLVGISIVGGSWRNREECPRWSDED